ncbi:MAG: GerMN domain-containing protein [Bacilli bacterium]|nr:GerMN domain-containing protein [Bacilli bacterium]
MLKKMSIRKITVSSLALLALLLIYIMPDTENNNTYKLSTKNIEYIYNNTKEVIYTLDKNNYVARTLINGSNSDMEDRIKNIIETLVIDGKNSNNIPNGFRSIIPEGTEILSLDLKDKILTINFSKELLDIKEEYEEKMIESIIYSLTSIDGIDKVIIKVEGKTLEKLPNSGKIISKELDKHYGINKKYNIVSPKNIESYTIYYVSKYNDNEYYVPVTKYINNDKKDKIKIIINELKTSPIYEENLMSYLSREANLIDYELKDDKMTLNFDESIYNNNSNNILEEVIYTISLSLGNNYDIKEVIFEVNDKEIYKKNIKTIE